MAHVDLTVAMIILALPIVVLALLRVAAAVADPIVARRSAALVRAIERASERDRAEGSAAGSATPESRLTNDDDEAQG